MGVGIEKIIKPESVSVDAYPVVPRGGARIRMQVSAAHTEQIIAEVIDAFDQFSRLA